MPLRPDTPIYHVVPRAAWEAARRFGRYAGSTRGSTVDDVGYVHCCFEHQVEEVAARVYAGESDLVVLELDPRLLAAEIRVEQLGAAAEPYPHVYGALDVRAVTAVLPLHAVGGGQTDIPPGELGEGRSEPGDGG